MEGEQAPAEVDYSTIPVAELLVHKVWKARAAGYDQLVQTLKTSEEPAEQAKVCIVFAATVGLPLSLAWWSVHGELTAEPPPPVRTCLNSCRSTWLWSRSW
jgi:hypothetical protein